MNYLYALPVLTMPLARQLIHNPDASPTKLARTLKRAQLLVITANGSLRRSSLSIRNGTHGTSTWISTPVPRRVVYRFRLKMRVVHVPCGVSAGLVYHFARQGCCANQLA